MLPVYGAKHYNSYYYAYPVESDSYRLDVYERTDVKRSFKYKIIVYDLNKEFVCRLYENYIPITKIDVDDLVDLAVHDRVYM